MPVRPYEIVYIIDPDVNETDTAALIERFRALAENQGATEIRVDTHSLGKRRLAYSIDHKREGQYVIMHFMGEAKVPAEVDRVLNITDNILRSMVVRLETMPPEPPPPTAPVVPEPETEPQPEVAEKTVEAPAAEEPVAEEAPAEAPEPEPAQSDEAAEETAEPAPESAE